MIFGEDICEGTGGDPDRDHLSSPGFQCRINAHGVDAIGIDDNNHFSGSHIGMSARADDMNRFLLSNGFSHDARGFLNRFDLSKDFIHDLRNGISIKGCFSVHPSLLSRRYSAILTSVTMIMMAPHMGTA